ncbi:MAG: hypothetical protein QW412_03420 [Candidatus Aenigmatarchaeota archaeon]
MIEQIRILGKLIKRLYKKEVYAIKSEEKEVLVDGKVKKVEEYKLYTSYPYDERKTIVVTCEKNRLGEKIKEIENACEERDTLLARILSYCRENRIDVPTDSLEYLERTSPEILKKILRNLEDDLTDPQIASAKKRCLLLHYAVEKGEPVVYGGEITLYPIPSRNPLEVLPPEKIEKLRNIAPWGRVPIKHYELKEIINGIEEEEEYPEYDFEIKD